ncbi:MAG: ABC transporter ATP-binding protein, partial [Gammaproteobacteria bacterium]|nr:ABC transporter ATP-binding protein [Gammaproteobacteria bacterium]
NDVAMGFQAPMSSLSPVFSVGHQVAEVIWLHQDKSRARAHAEAEELLEQVGIPEPARVAGLYPHNLSGGQLQRVMIAMALACRPALLIADEPTTALDVTIQAQILKLISDLQSRLNMAVLMITHDLGVVANVADDVVVLYHGEVMERGSVDRIFNAPGHEYTRALLGAVPNMDRGKSQRLVPLREIHSDSTRLLLRDREGSDPPGDQPASGYILELERVTKAFGARQSAWSMGSPAPLVRAVNDVSLGIRRGESLGLVGESGSGKSTLGKLIVRALMPDSGDILFHERGREFRVTRLSDDELFRYRCRVQYMFQDPVGSLNPSMTVLDILREPMAIHRIGDLDYQMETCKELMRVVGLDPRLLRRYPHSFSGGQRQRIGIARALALRPELLICDEPVSALDVSIQAQVLNLLRDLQQELGLTYLFISHNLAVVDYVSDRVAVMYRGQLVEIAPSEHLFSDARHPYTRALLNSVPIADPAHPLDFGSIGEGVAMADWPAPFAQASDGHVLETVGPDHFVRMQASGPATPG